MKRLFPNAAAVLLAVAMPAYLQTSNTTPAARGAPSAAEAKAFVDNAERDLANVSVYNAEGYFQPNQYNASSY